MRISEMQLTKRQLLGGVAAATASMAVYGTAQAQAAPEIPKPDGDVDMAKVLEPGALPEMALGKADAPVKIVEYMSMTCPHCAHFHNTTFDTIKQKYVDTGKVEFILREFPFDPRAAAAFMNRLFGVTMAEQGVSQLVSVDLQTAERLRETA